MTWGGRAVVTMRREWQARLPVDCPRCGLPVDGRTPWHLGHQHDRALGGKDTPDNIHPEHARCNTSAGGKLAHALRARGTPARPARRSW